MSSVQSLLPECRCQEPDQEPDQEPEQELGPDEVPEFEAGLTLTSLLNLPPELQADVISERLRSAAPAARKEYDFDGTIKVSMHANSHPFRAAMKQVKSGTYWLDLTTGSQEFTLFADRDQLAAIAACIAKFLLCVTFPDPAAADDRPCPF